MTAPADQPDRPPTGPPPGWDYTPRDTPPPADQAACTPDDADRLLYALGHGAGCDALLDDARRLCQSCPVQAECLDYALTAGEDEGIWGGCTEREREALRRRLKLPPTPRRAEPLQPCGTPAAHKRHLRAGEKPCQACREGRELRRQLANDPGRELVGAGRGGA